VFRHAVVNLADVLNECWKPRPATAADEVDWVVPHQANKRILDATARSSASPDRVVVTVDQHANTSAASVPLALDVAVGRAHQAGDLIVLEAMGGGFTWGAAVVRY
jgi:3-oxoacyl-[acyl-carrier-protein] synthase-3